MIRLMFLEGPRASGKTTIASAFGRLGWSMFKTDRVETVNPYGAQQLFLNNFLNRKDEKIVIDRFHFTEYIMSEYYERVVNNDIAFEDMMRVHNRILQIEDAAIMIVLPPLQLLLKRTKENGKEMDMPPWHAYVKWWALARKLDVPILYFTEIDHVKDFVKLVDGRASNG